jgi:hypothetical protein
MDSMACQKTRRDIVLWLHDELAAREGDALARHVEECVGCAAVLEEERSLLALLEPSREVEPGEDLLERCRRDLSETLGEEASRSRRAASARFLFRVAAAPRPLVAGLLVASGFLAGWIAFGSGLAAFRQLAGGAVLGADAEAAVTSVDTVVADPRGDRVSVRFDTRQHRSISGSPGEPEIRQLLLTTLADSGNAGLRLDALEALRPRADDREVRRALLRTLSADRNAGARLKALGMLQRSAPVDPEVRDGALQALLGDENAGIRVRAIDLLAGAPDPRMVAVFERLGRQDPNGYVRLRSAEALEALRAPAHVGER